MPRGQHGSRAGNSDADRLAAIERQLQRLEQQSLSAQAAPRGPAAGGGGGPAAARARRQGTASGGGGSGTSGTVQQGDWRCPSCGVYPCWARTRRCFKCRAPRPEGHVGAAGGASPARAAGGGGAPAAAVRGDAYLGPRGANGSRPLLGRRAASPPAAAAAGGGTACGRGPAQRQASGGNLFPPRAPPTLAKASVADDDGFQTVTRGVRPRVGSPPPARGQATAVCGNGGGDLGSSPSWADVARRAPQPAALDDDGGGEDDLDMDGDDGVGYRDNHDDADGLTDYNEEEGEGGVDDGGEADGGEDHPGADVEVLRAEWEKARLAHRRLERSSDMPPALVAEARRQRDAAEERWRAAKQPHPLHKRLRWAQRDLDAALLKQRTHQEEMERELRQMAERTSFLHDRAAVDEERTSRRRRALQELHNVGGSSAPPAPTTSDSECAARAAVQGIQQELGPSLCAIADKVEDGSPAWTELQAAMSTLSQVQAVLLRACNADCARRVMADGHPPADDAGGSPACFDISGGGSDAGGARGGQGGDGGRSGQTTTTTAARDCADPTRTEAAAKSPVAVAQRWAGPARSSADKWGGQAWKKQRDDDGAPAIPPATLGGGIVPAAGSAAAAKEAALSHLAARQHQLQLAQAREKEAADAARARQAEAERMQQAQLAQQQQAAAAAAAAAETVKQAQEAVAKAEAEEAQRLARDKQEAAARLSPEERRRAEELFAQQSAIAAVGFGTDLAVQGAGALHQAVAAAGGSGHDDVGDIMSMSAEQWHDSLPVDASAQGW